MTDNATPEEETAVIDNPKSKIQNPKSENALLLLPSYNDVRAVYGGQYIQGRGNEWKFKQYHTPLARPVLRIFEWQTGDEGEAFHLALVQPGWTDQGGFMEFREGGRSLTRLQFSASTFEFHPELTIRSAQREDYRASVAWLASPNGARAEIFLRNQDLSIDRRLRYGDFGAGDAIAHLSVPAGRLNLDLVGATRRVKDRREQLPTADGRTNPLHLTSRATTAALTYRTGSRSSVRASVTAAQGRSSPEGGDPTLRAVGTVVALDAVAMPARRVTVRGKLRRSRFSRNIVGTGYGRGDSGGAVDVKYLVSPRLVMRAGWGSRRAQYRNRAGGTDRPRTQSTWAGAAFRPLRGWEVRGQWEQRRISNPPFRVPTLPDGTPIVVTDPNGNATGSLLPLAHDRLRRTEVRVSGPLPRSGGITLGWVREERENRLRLTDFNLVRGDVTFWLPLTRRWTLTGTTLTEDRSGSPAPLRPWLSDDRVAMGSLTGMIGRDWTLSLLGTWYRVTGAFPAKSRWYALAARRRLTGSSDAEVRIQRETFTDEVTDRNSFRATTFVLEGRTAF